MDEEDDGEELIGEGMEADYREMGALDAYEEDGLDDTEFAPMDANARMAAEEELAKREVRERGTSRVPAALLTPEGDEEEDRPRRRRKEEPAQRDEGAGLEGILPDEEEVTAVHTNRKSSTLALMRRIAFVRRVASTSRTTVGASANGSKRLP